MSDKVAVSVSIVLFKPDMDVLARVFSCLKTSILQTLCAINCGFSIYVVDNDVDSTSPSDIENLANAHFSILENTSFIFLKSTQNSGYGAGNNLAILTAESSYHLIMNPDVFVYENTFLNAINYMQTHSNIGLLIPDVYDDEGARQHLCKRNPTIFNMYLRGFAPSFIKRIFQQRMLKFEMRDKDYDQEILDVPFPTGCFMFARSDVLKQLAGFDEKFFLYYEDADIGRRLLKISHSAYVPQVKIIHKWARESRQSPSMLWIFIKSALLYWRKHGGLF